MQTAIRVNTTVTADGKIEISVPELLPSKPVEVIILVSEMESNDPQLASAETGQHSAIEILSQTSGQRSIQNG